MFQRARWPARRVVDFLILSDPRLIFTERLPSSGPYHGSPTGKGLQSLCPLRPFSNLEGNHPRNCGEERDSNGCSTGCLAGLTLSHSWPEWFKLLEVLLQQGYLDPRDVVRTSFPPSSASSVPLGSDAKVSNHVRTACIKFARDRERLIRGLSYHDIHVVMRSGCPSVDRKIVNSGKRLRALVGIEERDVCTSCGLRGHCERAYVKPQEGEIGRTVDVIRILFTYALDFMTRPADSQLPQEKTLTRSVRKLLNEVLMFSAKGHGVESSSDEKTYGNDLTVSPHFSKKQMNPLKQGGWTCRICNSINFAENIKCLHCGNIDDEKLREQQEKRGHLPLKRGDWICNKCNFLNFAKNTRCLQCNEKAINRQLNPGEWECPSCGYINFRRNTACLKCDWKRPRSFLSSGSFSEEPSGDSCRHFQFANKNFHDGLQKKYFKTGYETLREHFIGPAATNDRGKFPTTGGKSALFCDSTEKQKWKRGKGIRETGRARIHKTEKL